MHYNIQEELKTQDNLYTQDPIFMVVEHRKIYYGTEEGFDDSEYDWVDIYESDLASEEEVERLKDISKKLLGNPEYLCEDDFDFYESFEKRYYIEEEFYIMPFLTKKGAQEFIDINKNKYRGKLSIFVESAYRNPEWRLIREKFLNNE